MSARAVTLLDEQFNTPGTTMMGKSTLQYSDVVVVSRARPVNLTGSKPHLHSVVCR